jgi:hypothetical protein
VSLNCRLKKSLVKKGLLNCRLKKSLLKKSWSLTRGRSSSPNSQRNPNSLSTGWVRCQSTNAAEPGNRQLSHVVGPPKLCRARQVLSSRQRRHRLQRMALHCLNRCCESRWDRQIRSAEAPQFANLGGSQPSPPTLGEGPSSSRRSIFLKQVFPVPMKP